MKLELNEKPDTLMIEWILRLPDEKADELLTEMVRDEMRDRLKQTRASGRCGWFGPQCSNARLKERLIHNLNEGDMVDVINLAAMILARQKLYGETA